MENHRQRTFERGSGPAEGARGGRTPWRSIRPFLADRRGNVIIITSLILPVFVTCACLTVDMAMTYKTKAGLQQSLDAAALAAAKMYGTTQDAAELQKAASAYFYANNGRDLTENTKLSFDGISTVNGLNVLQISATKDKPTYFGAAFKLLTGGSGDYSKSHISESSKVVIENKSIELALVLDNSGSMKDAPDVGGGKAKIDTLKTATTDLVNKLMAKNNTSSSNSANAVKIGVVPFSSAVNVGADHLNDAWMDTKGWSSIHHDNLDWSQWTIKDPVTTLNVPATAYPILATGKNAWRYKLSTGDWVWLTRSYIRDNATYNSGKSKLLPTWEGCIESRPNGLAFTDADASESNPDSLFVPEFAPDEPSDNDYPNSYLADYVSGADYVRQKDARKYFQYAQSKTAPGISEDGGPDFGCATGAITPLKNVAGTVTTAISKMQPKGATNIPEGLAWGWRILSSKEPFTEGRASTAKDNLKVMILITDGENTYYPSYSNGTPYEYTNDNKSMYGTYGFGQTWPGGSATPGHIFDGLSTTKKAAAANYYAAMNEMLGKVCTNIKNDGKSSKTDGGDGIIIATIAFDLPDGSKVKTLLQDCASKGLNGKGAPLYYDAKKSSDLVSAINDLVGQISSLRIYR